MTGSSSRSASPMAQEPPVGAVGHGSAWAHHGEILQGVFRGVDEAATPGLVTLPIARVASRAQFRVGEGPGISVSPPDRVRARRAVMSLATHLHTSHGRPLLDGHLSIDTQAPVGAGLGSSSADVVAALRAVHDLVGHQSTASSLCRFAVAVEGASDPLAHAPRAVLFAQRAGGIIEDFATTLPAMIVVSCVLGDGAGVDTLACPPPHEDELGSYERLRARLRSALMAGNAREVGAVATASALANQARLPRPELPLLLRIAETVGAVGVQVAHSGCVAGLLFDARSAGHQARAGESLRLLAEAHIPVDGTWEVLTDEGREPLPATSAAPETKTEREHRVRA